MNEYRLVKAAVTQTIKDRETFTVADIVSHYDFDFGYYVYDERGPHYPVGVADTLVRNELERRWHDGEIFKMEKDGKLWRQGRYVLWANPPGHKAIYRGPTGTLIWSSLTLGPTRLIVPATTT